MDVLPANSILKFNPNTLSDVRKQFNFDKSNINESIDVLDAWLQKQVHHVKKDYPREHLERAIIFNKGSVEKAKTKLDNICKLRRILPQYFGIITREQRMLLYPNVIDGFLPRLTPDNKRIYFLKSGSDNFDVGLFHYFRFLVSLAEYVHTNDYNNGLILIFDYSEVDIVALFKALNLSVMHHTLAIATDGYALRLAGVHVLSKNKGIDVIIKLFNQVLSAKLSSRIVVHKSIDSLYEYVPKDILPAEYGGTEKSLFEISENTTNEITSEAHQQHMIEMSKAVTNEEYRQTVMINTDFSGVPGTFRTIAID